MTQRGIIIALAGVIFIGGGIIFWWPRNRSAAVLTIASPTPTIIPSITPMPSPSLMPSPSPTLASSLILDVPFTIQAPNRNWDPEHEELCEEAASLMAQWFALGKTGVKEGPYQNHIPVADAEDQFKDLIDWENATFGDYKDTTADQTARMLKEKLNINHVTVTTDVSPEKIKHELNLGHLVLVPSAGRLLHNPNFKQPGPVYHMLVIRGYTANDEFVTNDPGIWQGEGWKYKSEVLMNAIHDWPGAGNDMQTGRKVAIIVAKE